METTQVVNVMHLTGLDFAIIAAYFVISLGIGVLFSKRAGESMEEYFISGRALPWWLAGTSMVATTFAADTPLAVTGLVITNGIAGNWVWWSMAIGGMLTVFFFARLWRRAEVLTDVELIDLRYSGKTAKVLRVFRALYLAIPINCLIVGWVTMAIVKVMKVSLGANEWTVLIISLVITGIYSVLSGLWGVAITDFVQFIIAMTGCIILAVLAVKDVGGLSTLIAGITEKYGATNTLKFIPDFHSSQEWMPVQAFLIFLGVTWWASWYPGAEPGGGGYVVQRMASCKDERHSVLATLWFQVAHYALRPWPWIIVALCALYYYPQLHLPNADANAGFPMIMAKVLPPGMRGLMIVAFFAAFMSTLATQINWGASYVINDFYKPFIKPSASSKHYIFVSRIATVVILFIGAVVSTKLGSVEQAWKIMLTIGAGTGMVFLLRWFWWRINAWAEISAMVASLIIGCFLIFGFKDENGVSKLKDYNQILITAISTMVIWVVVMFLTPPESEEKLISFFRKVRPGGPGWRRIQKKAPDVIPDKNLGVCFVAWILASVMVYSVLFGIGKLIFGFKSLAILLFCVAIFCAGCIYIILSKFGWKEITK